MKPQKGKESVNENKSEPRTCIIALTSKISINSGTRGETQEEMSVRVMVVFFFIREKDI